MKKIWKCFCASTLLMVTGIVYSPAIAEGSALPAVYLLLFKEVINPFINPSLIPRILNDTGITWGGNATSGNNADCSSDMGVAQDCSQGRDTTNNNDADGHAGFSFTKLDPGGVELPADAATWSCVRDNVTKLVWEAKTDDGGIHDKDNKYKWGGSTVLGSGYGNYYTDWESLVNGSNNQSLCGYSNWRVPTVNELTGLINYGRHTPSIDTVYFPYTQPSYYWSSSPSSSSQNTAWWVHFLYGHSNTYDRILEIYVRLVSSGQ